MKSRVLNVIPVATASYRAAGRAIVAMVPLTIIAVALLVVVNLGRLWLLLRSPYFGLIQAPRYGLLIAVIIAFAVVEAVILAVWMIAIQRYLLLAERPTQTAITQNLQRHLRYACFLAIVTALFRLMVLMALPDFQLVATERWLLALMQALYLVIALLPYVLLVLFAVLFPAIAIDAAAVTLEGALADTRRGAWRIFLVVLLTQLPILVISWIVSMTAIAMGTSFREIFVTFASILFAASMAVYAASCTYVYACYANAVKQPPVSVVR